MGTLFIEDNQPVLKFISPMQPESRPRENTLSSVWSASALISYSTGQTITLTAEGPFSTLNLQHPVAQMVHENRFTKREQKSDLEVCIETIANCLSETSTLKLLSDPNYTISKQDSWKRYIGRLYFSVDWGQAAPSLRPPYTVWVQSWGFFEVGDVDFKKWADA